MKMRTNFDHHVTSIGASQASFIVHFPNAFMEADLDLQQSHTPSQRNPHQNWTGG